MHDWFSVIGAGHELSAGAAQNLRDIGFVVIPGPVAADGLARLAAAYDRAVASADSADVSVGSTTTRVHDFVNRGPEFDALYVCQPVLEACCRVIGHPFKLSTMLARTVRPRSPAQALHVDYERDTDGWPMVGFILMVDEFCRDNGATRFMPGSHEWPAVPDGLGAIRGQSTKAMPWRVARRAPSSSTTVPSGTGTRRICPASPAARFKAHISGVKSGREATCPHACAPKLSPASARWQDISWPSDGRWRPAARV